MLPKGVIEFAVVLSDLRLYVLDTREERSGGVN